MGIRAGSPSIEPTLCGRDFILLDAVLDALDDQLVWVVRDATSGSVVNELSTHRSLTYLSGIRIVKVVPVPGVLLRDMLPPMSVAS